jgi:peptide-methionine (S)-S-oxide reductase
MTAKTECAIFASGCFCGMQQLVRRLPGAVSTRVGYTGGDVRDATYRNHGTHAEAIEIVFDPDTMTFRDLLEFFFQIHDPTTLNRQSPDRGVSYRSAIFWRRVRVLARDQPDRLRHDKQPFLVRRRRREWRWQKGDPR